MPQPSTADLVVRAGLVLLVSASLVCGGALLDILAGTSPFGLLIFLAGACTLGTVKIFAVITSSYPKAPQGAPESQDGKPQDK